MEEEALEAIIASVFLIIISLIGLFLPVLASQMFQGHNPYLVLEVAGFLTYSTSEPGRIEAAIPMTQFADILLEFRIIPPINTGWVFSSYNNKDFLVSIGFCIENNLWEQLGLDAFNSLFTAVTSYFAGVGSSSFIKAASTVIKYQSQGFIMGLAATTTTNYIQGTQIYGNNVIQNLANSFLSSLSTTAFFTGLNLGQTLLDVGIYLGLASGGIGLAVAVAANFLINAVITLIQYENAQQNSFLKCYHYGTPSDIYFVYNPIFALPVYYNPTFYIYNNCDVPELCNLEESGKNPVAYNVNDINSNYIIKIEMGYYNSTTKKYYYPLFLILVKEDQYKGDSLGYINVSIISAETS
jgi:hypothetical protein